jgi:hypothetical protein
VENIYRVTILSANYCNFLLPSFITLMQSTQANTHRQKRSRKWQMTVVKQNNNFAFKQEALWLSGKQNTNCMPNFRKGG